MEQSNLFDINSPQGWFQNACLENGVAVSQDQINQLSKYADGLIEWNQKINLISRKDEANIWKSHFLHAVSLLFFLKFPSNSNVLDLGTGGGLPGIPLKILRLDINLTLLDSTKKKIDAVADMIDKLELRNTIAVWGRAEELSRKTEFTHKMDIVIARAVAPLSDLLQWSLPFFDATTRKQSENLSAPAIVALKGGDLQEEVRMVQHHKRIKNIRIIDIVFKNIDVPELQDKKIVVVELTKA